MFKKQYATLLVIAAISGALGASLFYYLFTPMSASAQAPSIIKAQQLLVVDSRGILRASLNPAGGYEEYTGFSLFDKNGKARLVVQVSSDNRPPTISFYSANGTLVSTIPISSLISGSQPRAYIHPVQKISHRMGGKADQFTTGQDLNAVWVQIDYILATLEEIRKSLGN